MGRPPRIGLVVMLLVGLTGCAGVPQRLSWSSPSTDSTRTDDTSPLRFSWWRRVGNPNSGNAETATRLSGTAKTRTTSGDTAMPTDGWPEPKSDGLSRFFPLLSRRWDSSSSSRDRDDARSRAELSRLTARSGAAPQPTVAPDDRDVLPVESVHIPGSGLASNAAVNLTKPRESDNSTTPTSPMITAARPYSLPELAGNVELDVSSPAERPPGPAPADNRPPVILPWERPEKSVASSDAPAAVEPATVAEQEESKSESLPVQVLPSPRDVELVRLAVEAPDDAESADNVTPMADSSTETSTEKDADPTQGQGPKPVVPPPPSIQSVPARGPIPPALLLRRSAPLRRPPASDNRPLKRSRQRHLPILQVIPR